MLLLLPILCLLFAHTTSLPAPISTESAERIATATDIYDTNGISNTPLPPFASLVFQRATWTSAQGESETEFLLRHAGIKPLSKGDTPPPMRRRLSQQNTYDNGEPKHDAVPTDRTHVLDFGYGAGHMTRLLRQSLDIKHQVHGIEISSVQAARATADTIAVDSGLAAGIAYGTHLGFGKLPYRNQFFSHVLSQQVFSHCPDRAATFAEIYRVLQPGGQLTFQDIFVSRSRDAVLHVEPVNNALGSVIGSITEYKKELAAAGFIDIHIESIHDLADTIDVQRHLTESTSAGMFTPSKQGQRHPDLLTLDVETARVEYGNVAVANALAHNAVSFAVVQVRRPGEK